MPEKITNNKIKDFVENDQKDLGISDLLSIIWSGKYFILFICFISVAFSVFYLNFAEYKYSVSLKVIPVSKPNLNQARSRIDSLTNISSIFLGSEVDTSQGGSYDYELYKALIKSPQVSNFLSKDKNFMISVFASEWDSENMSWKRKELSFFSKFKNAIKNILGIPVFIQGKPSAQRLNKFLSNSIAIIAPKNSKTSMITISMLTSNPDLGIEIIENVHIVANEILREKSSLRTQKYINFLNLQLSKTTQQDQRLALISTLSSQLQKKMDESSDLPFVSEKFGDVVVSTNPVYPNSKLILATALIVSFFSSIIILMFRYQFLKVK